MLEISCNNVWETTIKMSKLQACLKQWKDTNCKQRNRKSQ
jgi:hypothetical protein